MIFRFLCIAQTICTTKLKISIHLFFDTRNPMVTFKNMSINLATLLVPCISKCHYSISHVKKQMDTNFELCSPNSQRDILETYKSGKTVVKIWQPCQSDIFPNATIRFLVSKNRGMLIFSFVVLIFWKIHRNPQIWQH